MNLETSPEMTEAIGTAIDERKPFQLADVTSWTWDTVYIFGGGVTAKAIEEALDDPVIDEQRFTGTALFVFLNNEEIVRAVPSWSEWFLIPSEREFSQKVRVEVVPSGPGALVGFAEES